MLGSFDYQKFILSWDCSTFSWWSLLRLYIMFVMDYTACVLLLCDKALWNTFFDINYRKSWVSLDSYDKIFRRQWELGLKCFRFYSTFSDDQMFLFLMECSLFVIATFSSCLSVLLNVFLNQQLSIRLEINVSVQGVLTFLETISLGTFETFLVLQ